MGDIIIKVDGALDINEAAAELGISYATIYRWIKKNIIRPVQIDGKNYIPLSEIERIKRENDAQPISD